MRSIKLSYLPYSLTYLVDLAIGLENAGLEPMPDNYAPLIRSRHMAL